MTITDYLHLIPPMNREKSRFISFLSAILSQAEDLDDLRLDLLSSFSPDSAEGNQLDILGRLTGISRVLPYEPSFGTRTLDDDDFRFLIRAKILRDHWDGTNEGILSILHTLFPDTEITFSDEQDMTLKVTIPPDFSTSYKEMLEHGLLLPKPPGIALNVTVEN